MSLGRVQNIIQILVSMSYCQHFSYRDTVYGAELARLKATDRAAAVEPIHAELLALLFSCTYVAQLKELGHVTAAPSPGGGVISAPLCVFP
jgi:hypothetical protein